MQKSKVFLKVFLIILLLNASVYSNDYDNFKEEWLKVINDTSTATITDSLVMLELQKNGIPFTKNFLIRIKKESGNYKSKLSTEYNNITGMRLPAQRKTTATHKNRFGYASYNCWKECIKDLKYFIEFRPPKQNETYYQFMKRRQYNPYYINKK